MMQVNRSLPVIVSKPNLWPLKINGTYATESQLSYWENKLLAEFQNYIDSACLVETSDGNVAINKGFTLIDGTDKKPASKSSDLYDRVSTRNKDFYARSKAGEIIMSPMHAFKISVITESILTSSYPWNNMTATITYETLGYVKDGPDGLILGPGVVAGALTRLSPAFAHNRVWNYNCEWSNPPLIPAEFIRGQLNSFDPTELITSTYADANTKAVDILTAFAEMPETIKSVLSGFKEVARLIKDVKTRNLELVKGRNQRLENIRKRFQSRLDSLIGKVRSAKDNRRRRALENAIRALKRENSKTVKRILDDFASALANVWLNFRYNIMPNVYLVEDTVKAFNNFNKEYARTSKGASAETELSIFGHVIGTISSHYKCIIKREFDLSNIPWNSTVSANLVNTAYELVPLSFVVDWFVNIGDILSGITTPPSWKQQAAGLRTKHTGSVSKTLDNQDIKAKIKIAIEYYDYKVFNPLDEIGLCFPMDLSPVRQLDALALIWRPVRLLLRNAIQR